ncbi:hypothetical protein [Silvimonas iriomotensis]|uniref:hypothetical protein n=1 Tax=Silvimonas iriomotensis TaxID=449662 RepID=UPI0035714273
MARKLGALQMINAASPAYLAKFGTPRTLADLFDQGHRMVHYTPTLGNRPYGWEYPRLPEGNRAFLELACVSWH